MKSVIISQDLSGLGQISLNVAVPIVSAFGLQPLTLPTMYLSGHTGGLGKPKILSLSEVLSPTLQHWKKLNIQPKGLYLGYLGQEALSVWQKEIKTYQNLAIRLIDPAMADNGQLYHGFDQNYVEKMKGLLKSATIITPNIEEACLLLNQSLKENYSVTEARKVARDLGKEYQSEVVVTGIPLSDLELGLAGYSEEKSWLIKTTKVSGSFFGTGDIFASTIFSLLVEGADLYSASMKTSKFLDEALKFTIRNEDNHLLGINYFPALHNLISEKEGEK